MVPITGSPSFFVGIDFDAQYNTIFFSDLAKDIIYKQKIDGTGEEGICVFDLFSPNATIHSVCCVVHAGLELAGIPLLQPPEFWVDGYEQP